MDDQRVEIRGMVRRWRVLARRLMSGAFLPLVVAGTLGAIFARHISPMTITGEDVAIIGAGLTLAATGLAYRAASESREAARESHRALALHFRPGQVRVGFTVRDPNYPQAQMAYVEVPPRSPLWVSVTFWSEVQPEYEMEWIDYDGCPRSRTLVPDGFEKWYQLEGLHGDEIASPSGLGRDLMATVPRLKFTCQDHQVGTYWRATLSKPDRQALGSYVLTFEPLD